MRLLRTLLTLKIGAWLGMLAAAAVVKRAVPSQGDEESDEVSLVAVLDGIDMKSRARAFRGGSMFAWFGGIAIDLTEVELVSPARLSLTTVFGGIALDVPPGWRVVSRSKSLAGGIDAQTRVDDPGAPVLEIEGLALFGGIAVGPGMGPGSARGGPRSSTAAP